MSANNGSDMESVLKHIKNRFYAIGFVSDDALSMVREKMAAGCLSDNDREFYKQMERSLVCIQENVSSGMERLA